MDLRSLFIPQPEDKDADIVQIYTEGYGMYGNCHCFRQVPSTVDEALTVYSTSGPMRKNSPLLNDLWKRLRSEIPGLMCVSIYSNGTIDYVSSRDPYTTLIYTGPSVDIIPPRA